MHQFAGSDKSGRAPLCAVILSPAKLQSRTENVQAVASTAHKECLACGTLVSSPDP